MNKNAIVLGADSAVTINGKKIRTGVEKLFKLSDEPPMGMMIFGNANFQNIPMETLIKQYSKKTKFKKLKNIGNIQDDFLKYLSNVTPPFDFKKAIKDNLDDYLKEVEDKFDEISKGEFDEFISCFKEDEALDFVKDLKEFNLFDNVFCEIIPDFVSKKDLNHVVHVLKMKFFYKIVPSSTGVVIAGFSEEDLFPSFVSFELVLNNGGKIEFKSLKSKINYYFGYIMPFAQRDVIDTFLTGSSILVKDVLRFYLLSFFDNYDDLIIDVITSNDKFDEKSREEFVNEIKKIKSLNEETIDQFMMFFDTLEDIMMKPILASISTMPKKELIDMANSLIGITSLRRKIDSDIESVGGEIALAIITKGEGFVWINKINPPNYNLNPHILNNS